MATGISTRHQWKIVLYMSTIWFLVAIVLNKLSISIFFISWTSLTKSNGSCNAESSINHGNLWDVQDKKNKICYSNISHYSWSADARATDELTSGIARCSCAPSLDSVLAPKIQKRNIFGKGVSDLKARLDYCKDPVRSCESLILCFPSQTEPF